MNLTLLEVYEENRELLNVNEDSRNALYHQASNHPFFPLLLVLYGPEICILIGQTLFYSPRNKVYWFHHVRPFFRYH